MYEYMHTFLLPIKGHSRIKCLKTVTLYIWHSLLWKNPLKSCGFLQLLDLRASRYLSTVFATSFVQLQTSHAGSPQQKRSIRWYIHQWAKPRKPPKIKDLSNHTCLKISIPRNFQVKPLALGRFAQNLWNDSNFQNTSMYVCLLLRCCYLESWL